MKYKSYDGKEYQYESRLYTRRDGDYAHIYVDFMYTDESGEKRYQTDLNDFKISCQIDRESVNRSDNPCYAMRFEYSGVSLDNYQDVMSIFKKIDSGMTKLHDQLGQIESMGDYITRILLVIGVKYIWYNDSSCKASDSKWIVTNFINSLKENWYR